MSQMNAPTLADVLKAFRAEHPSGAIETTEELRAMNGDLHHVLFRAIIRAENGNTLANVCGIGNRKELKQAILVAENNAIGRALKLAGFGDMLTPQFNELPDRVVDAPLTQEDRNRIERLKELVNAGTNPN